MLTELSHKIRTEGKAMTLWQPDEDEDEEEDEE